MSWGVISFLIKEVLNGAPYSHKKKIVSVPKGKGHLQFFYEIQGVLLERENFMGLWGRW